MIKQLFLETTYTELYLLTVGYFLLLYFGVGMMFSFICSLLLKKGWLSRISEGLVTRVQVKFEIRHSLTSIAVFGFSSLPIVALIRSGKINFHEDNFSFVLLGVLALNLWNEVYFFLVHRLMHTPFFMRHVHRIHHRSLVPTTWSVYSFHWVEAALLSSVPFFYVLVLPVSPLILLLYPLTSILLNFAGHCNLRFGKGEGNVLSRFGTVHNSHHSKGLQHFGFATPFVDWLYQRITGKHE